MPVSSDAGTRRRLCGGVLAPFLLGGALVAVAGPAHATVAAPSGGTATTATTATTVATADPAATAGTGVSDPIPTVPTDPVVPAEPLAGLHGLAVTSAAAAAAAPPPVFTAMNAAGLASSPTPLADWAPDGSRMAYVNGSVVTSVRPDGSAPVTVSTSLTVNALSWSGRGARLALSGSETATPTDLPQLWITTPLGVKAYKVTAPGVAGRRTTGVTWLDGVTLVVSYTQTGSTVSRLARVTLQDPAASSTDLVPDDPTAALADTSLLDPAGSPDGRMVAYRQRVPDGAGGTVDSLWVTNRYGVGSRKLAEAAQLGRPVWSADSRTVYVQQPGAGTDSVIAAPVAGTPLAAPLATGVTSGQVLARVPVSAGPTLGRRVTGRDPVETSIAAARQLWPALPAARGTVAASAVVLVNQVDWPSVAVGGPLAAAKRGPLLLGPAGPERRVIGEVRRMLAPGSTVYLVGTPTMLNATLVTALAKLRYRVVRFTGADSYSLAVNVAVNGLGRPRSVVYASRSSWQDSMVAAAAAGRLGAPVLFTAGTKQVAANVVYLRTAKPSIVWAVGRPAVAAVPTARPASGADWPGTALAAATAIFLPASTAVLAHHGDLTDTMVASATAARLAEPLLFTAATTPGPRLAAYLDGSSGSVDQVWLFGRPTVPAPAVLTAAATLGGGRIG